MPTNRKKVLVPNNMGQQGKDVLLARDDIERMDRDAETHAEEDRRRRDEAEVRNTADTLVYQTEKLLREQGEKFEGSEKEDVSAALQKVKDALSGSDMEAIKSATDALMTASQGFSQRLYEQASQASSSSGASTEQGSSPDDPSEEEVVDAEIVDEQ